MKFVISMLPMMALNRLQPMRYPVDGNKPIEYDGEVRYPINAVLAKTLKKDEDVTVLFIATTGGNSFYEENNAAFRAELGAINASIGAKLSFETIEIPFLPTKRTFNTLLTDLTDRIPRDARIFADMTYGSKPPLLPLFCALAFAEKFCDAVIEYIIYGKVEFNKDTQKPEHPMIFDVTSLYYLFKLIGSIEAPDAEAASKFLKDFFAI